MSSNAFLTSSSAFGTESATSLSALLASSVASSFFFSRPAACSDFSPSFSAAWLASLAICRSVSAAFSSFSAAAANLVDLVFQFLPLGVLGGLGLLGIAGRLAISRLRGPPP